MQKEDKAICNTKPSTLEECWGVISQLTEVISNLTTELSKLKEQLNLNSNNSSLPPSKDFKKKKAKSKKSASGKKRGGQAGHSGHKRKLFPSSEADEIIKCVPQEECDCGGRVSNIKLSIRKQVLELPQPKYLLHEYQVYSGSCECCKTKKYGSLPEGIGNRYFGAKAHGLMSLLRSKYRLSQRQVKQLMQDLYGLPISLGSVCNAEARVSEAIKVAHEEVGSALQTCNLPINIDETGFKQCNKNGWAWILANKCYTYFYLSNSRGKKIAKHLLSPILAKANGMVISDRYPAYNFIPEDKHQVCWAHLKRDFQRISEREGAAGQIGVKLLKYYRLLFKFWKTDGHTRWWFASKMRKKRKRLCNKLLQHLRRGASCGHPMTQRTCENILSHGNSLWNFFDNQNVEPTNNLAERQLRPLVIAKKLSFGANSARGARFIERIFTIVMTCAQQGKNVVEYLNQSIANYFANKNTEPLVANLAWA